MAETTTQITAEELKKMLDESNLSAEMKTGYGEVLDQMTNEEKFELVRIMNEKNEAEVEYMKESEERIQQLAKLNAALEKHLANSLRDEEKNIREEFQKIGEQEDKEEMQEIESEINQL